MKHTLLTICLIVFALPSWGQTTFSGGNISGGKISSSKKNEDVNNRLNKLPKSNINCLNYEKRHSIKSIGKKILFCLPPNIGLGDAIEYASALKLVSDSNIFEKLAVAFMGEIQYLFRDHIDKKYIF